MPYVLTLNANDLELTGEPTDQELGSLLRLLSDAEPLDGAFLDGLRFRRILGVRRRQTVSIEHVDLKQIGDPKIPETEPDVELPAKVATDG